jgi:uncharacterized membrane protein
MYWYEQIKEFSISSLQHFPFTMFVSFFIMGFIFFQPTWSLVSIGMIMVYLVVQILQILLAKIGFLHGFASSFESNKGEFNPAYPYSTGEKKFQMPSEWMTQTAFVLIFVIWNSFKLSQKSGNKKLFEAYQRRMRRTEISIIVAAVLLVSFMVMRITTESDSILSVLVSTGLASGLAIGYWHLLDICNTQLHSDILGITRNMAPVREVEEAGVICTV